MIVDIEYNHGDNIRNLLMPKYLPVVAVLPTVEPVAAPITIAVPRGIAVDQVGQEYKTWYRIHKPSR